MLVSFYFECPIHGRFVEYLDTKDYPDRVWPDTILCTHKNWRLFLCCAVRIPITDNFIQDSIGVSPSEDKYVLGTDKHYNSKSYLKREMKSLGLTVLTQEESKTIKRKTDDERHKDYLDRPDIKRERMNNINEALNGFGVIDSLTEN